MELLVLQSSQLKDAQQLFLVEIGSILNLCQGRKSDPRIESAMSVMIGVSEVLL